MVYNFALPPLVLHTFQTGSSAALTKWAMGLHRVSNSATYFNILDSHDGIGVLGAKNILTDEEIEMMALRVVEHGGFISFKDNGDGTASPYELNTTWYSALNRRRLRRNPGLQDQKIPCVTGHRPCLDGGPGEFISTGFSAQRMMRMRSWMKGRPEASVAGALTGIVFMKPWTTPIPPPTKSPTGSALWSGNEPSKKHSIPTPPNTF